MNRMSRFRDNENEYQLRVNHVCCDCIDRNREWDDAKMKKDSSLKKDS